MSILEEMSPEHVGERLRIAREKANFTQEDAAKEIDVARTTLVAIEQGHRRARIGEVQRLAKAYGTSVNALLREEAAHVDLVPRFASFLLARIKPRAKPLNYWRVLRRPKSNSKPSSVSNA